MKRLQMQKIKEQQELMEQLVRKKESEVQAIYETVQENDV
jgi:hypothetical protein